MTGRYQTFLRWLECLFLFGGLLALDYYIWVTASAALSQAYENWSFTRELQGREVSIPLFVREQIDSLRGVQPSEPERPQTAAARPQAPPRAPATPPFSVIGRLEIPRLHMNLMVREGVTEGTLRLAVGHLPSTALPGHPGNVALAAHRDTFFRPLRDIRNHDSIVMETPGGTYRYVVESIQIVKPNDTWVLRASGRPTLTLVTCYPFTYIGSAPKRFIVRATAVGGFERNPDTLRSD